MGTALTSEIGYEKAAALVNEAHATGRTIRDLAREKSGIPEERLSSLLNPLSQVGS
jgi:fumarate hydratase class II